MSMRALDLCTGSGCVALTLGRERPTATIVGADLSAEALAVARENLLRLGAYNVSLRQGDLFGAVDAGARFDLVTANAPYIPSAEIATLQPEVRDFEPRSALDGGADGLDLVRRIVDDAPSFMRSGATLTLEVGMGEAPEVARRMATRFGVIEIARDYAGIERVVSGVLERS
jgi:release factor glutamine methyltransferase